MQQQSGQLYVHRFPSARCSVMGGSRPQFSFVLNRHTQMPHGSIRAIFCNSSYISKPLTGVAESPLPRSYSHQPAKHVLPLQYFHPEGKAFQTQHTHTCACIYVCAAAQESAYGYTEMRLFTNTCIYMHRYFACTATIINAFYVSFPIYVCI